jgi:hypothetical protein
MDAKDPRVGPTGGESVMNVAARLQGFIKRVESNSKGYVFFTELERARRLSPLSQFRISEHIRVSSYLSLSLGANATDYCKLLEEDLTCYECFSETQIGF